MAEEQEAGFIDLARNVGVGAMLGGFLGVMSLMNPAARGHDFEILFGSPVGGGFVAGILSLLSDVSRKGTVWFYIVWSFTCTLTGLAVLAVEFTIHGYDGSLLLWVMISAPILGILLAHRHRRWTRR